MQATDVTPRGKRCGRKRIVVRTTVYLSPELKQVLAIRSLASGRSMSDLVEEAAREKSGMPRI